MLKKVIWAVAGLLIVAQLIRPDLKNPAVEPRMSFQDVTKPPAEVLTLLKNACYNCHSHETRYPWYAKVAPVSWWVAGHVNEGREHLNFSRFGHLDPTERAEAMGEAAEVLREGEMPLPSYTWLGMHPEARLSAGQRDLLAQWFEAQGGGEGPGGGEQGED